MKKQGHSELRRKHAAQFSVPEEQVGLITLDLQILREAGTFVTVHARGLTMFTRQATWEELGVPAGSARILQYRPPLKHLIDPSIPRWLESWAEATRNDLRKVGLKVDFMEPYLWVSFPEWGAWRASFDQRRKRWDQYVETEIIGKHAAHKQELAQRFTASAREAYEALRAAGVTDLGNQDEFVSRVVSAAVASFPSPEYIRAHLVLEYEVPALVTPDLVEEELRRLDKLALAREQERLETERALESAREQQRFAMFQERIARYVEQVASSEAPLTQVLGAILGDIENTVAELQATLSEHGNLRGRSGERLRNLAARVRVLSELGRRDLLDLVEAAAALTQRAANETEEQTEARLAVLETTLKQVQEVLAACDKAAETFNIVAEEVGQRRFRSLCLRCRKVWDSRGSLEPRFCPACRADTVVSREL